MTVNELTAKGFDSQPFAVNSHDSLRRKEEKKTMTEEMRELILADMGDTRPDCPITGGICNNESQCGECQIGDDYRKWLKESERKEETV